jgi:acylaminoacyl-peptidase
MMRLVRCGGVTAFVLTILASARGQRPPLTLDDFFNSVDIRAVKIAPDGHAVVVETRRADWAASRFRSDLWLYRERGNGSSMQQLTRSGHDSSPEWSPDGRWIAFLSDRPQPSPPADEPRSDDKEKKDVAQLYVIPADGGEAFPVTNGKEEVHAFAWTPDSCMLYYATRTPWSKEKEDAYKKEWKDVNQFRESERGDQIRDVQVQGGVGCRWEGRIGPWPIWTVENRLRELAVSPDQSQLAIATESRSEREEDRAPYGISIADLPGGPLHLALHTEDTAENIRWSPDSRHVFFSYSHGTPEGPYEDPQARLYDVDVTTGKSVRWMGKFTGSVSGFAVTNDGRILAAGLLGTEVEPYIESSAEGDFTKQPGWPGTYEQLSAAPHSSRVAFVYSSLERPAEVYLAEGPEQMEQAKPITSFNRPLAERELPKGKPYRWMADDGATVEGMLIYPPGKFEAKALPLFVLIHGGPEDADGNHFEADWYQWAALAATDGWLVFEPNYRGSVGYGDTFALGIIPHIVSRPGKDILQGVDALVKDGIADPDRLTVGGYSYGGYMTNWLITQTTRFKAAVTGAGAVEHVANWGNDDTTFDDAYFLGGLPWEAEPNYNAEAAIWQFSKVMTPTHVVGGGEDIRVYVGEDYLLERALHARGIPTSLLIFPGEGHSLGKNPWHGKIKVREELKWLKTYGGK